MVVVAVKTGDLCSQIGAGLLSIAGPCLYRDDDALSTSSFSVTPCSCTRRCPDNPRRHCWTPHSAVTAPCMPERIYLLEALNNPFLASAQQRQIACTPNFRNVLAQGWTDQSRAANFEELHRMLGAVSRCPRGWNNQEFPNVKQELKDLNAHSNSSIPSPRGQAHLTRRLRPWM